jgi:hypothetical protein
MPPPLDADEPQQSDRTEDARDKEINPQAEEIVRVVDPLGLLEDTKGGVAGDIQREDARRSDAVAMPALEPGEKPRQEQVPDELIQEGRLKRGVLEIARGPVGG